ncbi:MAG: hypothetical protein M3Y76_10920 [Chloroflexota bacterium]|nr:hypothetical protein [Chloroflexota bacterium]
MVEAQGEGLWCEQDAGDASVLPTLHYHPRPYETKPLRDTVQVGLLGRLVRYDTI